MKNIQNCIHGYEVNILIIVNEKEYVLNRVKNNDIGENPHTTISLLARYYYHELGYKHKKICTLLNEFLNSTYPRYAVNKKEWDESIERISKEAPKYELFCSNGVLITDKELDAISKLNNKILEKLAFTLLCLAKLYNQKTRNNNSWVNTEIKDIFNMAGIKSSDKVRAKKIGILISKGYIRYAVQVDNLNMKVLFVDDTGENKLLISDFRELGNEYLLYKGGNFIRCAECGRLIPDNKQHNKKYCKGCSSYTLKKTKVVTCIDCGKAFIVNSLNNRAKRCNNCQKEYRKEYQKIKMREKRKNVSKSKKEYYK